MVDDQAKAIEALKAEYQEKWIPEHVVYAFTREDVLHAMERAVSISRASQGSRVGTETAARALIDDVRRRYPGEELRCPLMRALDDSLRATATPQAPEDILARVEVVIATEIEHLTGDVEGVTLDATLEAEQACMAEPDEPVDPSDPFGESYMDLINPHNAIAKAADTSVATTGRSLPPKHARFAASALLEWVATARASWGEDPPGNWDWNDIGLIDSAVSFLSELGSALQHADQIALGHRGRKSVRWIIWETCCCRDEMGNGEFADLLAGRIEDAGLLSGLPHVTVHWNTALETFYGAIGAPLGTASDGLLAVLRSIPGIEIVEG
ncbi:MAG: hypothetical protein V4564_07630 [Pseudomonadota bacterium]